MTLDLFTPPESDPQEWTQVYLSRTGRTYRYRVHLDRIQDLSVYDDQDPGVLATQPQDASQEEAGDDE